jgi:hypothetical protein
MLTPPQRHSLVYLCDGFGRNLLKRDNSILIFDDRPHSESIMHQVTAVPARPGHLRLRHPTSRCRPSGPAFSGRLGAYFLQATSRSAKQLESEIREALRP